MSGTIGPHRPLVVLCGWLGSRPNNLRRYDKIYHDLGFRVWCRVATPVMVVNSSFAHAPLTVPRLWPRHQLSASDNTMESLAWDILADMDSSSFPMVFFHVFSNGGCFLWEKISSILHLAEAFETNRVPEDAIPLPVQRRLAALRERIVGTVFDSCPGSDLKKLPSALNYCSWEEKIKVLMSTRFVFFSLPNVQKAVEVRAAEYMKTLTEDTWALPQLYMYSEDDILAPYQSLNELVAIRKQLHGSEIIWNKTWRNSAHCTHLYHHSDDYRSTLTSFTKMCMMRDLTKHKRSRL